MKNATFKYNLEQFNPSLMKLPKSPSFYEVIQPIGVFKAVLCITSLGNSRHAIANLIIPVGAIVRIPSESKAQKCRASVAEVHSIVSIFGEEQFLKAHSSFNRSFIYTPGETVRPDNTFSMKNLDCASGIHFFFHLNTAKRYL